MKHPVQRAASEDAKLHGWLPTIENIIFDINNSLVLEAAKITQGGFGSSEMDVDGWRQILVSTDYGDAGNDLRKTIIFYKENMHRRNRLLIFVSINGIKIGTTQ